MDPFEKAIRGAFEKSDPSDLSVRRRVYKSALAALDRAIAANASVTEPQAAARRDKLKKLITSIETEFAPAVATAAQDTSIVQGVTPRQSAPPVGGVEPRLRAQAPAKKKSSFGDAPRSEPRLESASTQHPNISAPDMGEDAAPGVAARIRTKKLRNEGKKSRWPKFILNLVILLLIIGACIYGVYWVRNVDLKQFSNSNSQEQNLDFTSLTVGGKHDKNWVTIFDPADLSTVQTLNGATASLSSDGRASYLEIASPSDASVTRFDVGLGTLQTFMGKKVTVLVSAKAVSAESSDIAVSCNFGSLGSCARKRFTVSGDVKDFLFEYEFPDQSPNAAGSIDIISDIDGGGKGVKIVKILIRDAAEN